MIHAKFGLFSTLSPLRILEAETPKTPLRQLSNGFFNPNGALLRSPLFPVPMANPSWGHGVKRSGSGGVVRQQQPCSTSAGRARDKRAEQQKGMYLNRVRFNRSDAERKGHDDAMWEGDYDEPIVYVYRSSGKSGPIPSTVQIATMNITGRRTTAIGVLTVHTRKPRTGREQP